MSDQRSAFMHLLDAEPEVDNIARWGAVLVAMGTGENDISPGAAFVVGQALERLGWRLEELWNAAADAAREADRRR